MLHVAGTVNALSTIPYLPPGLSIQLRLQVCDDFILATRVILL
jgi:hypothetical protein